MINYIIIGIVGLILFLASGFILKQKKKGVTCVGCPDSGACSGRCGSCTGCNCGN